MKEKAMDKPLENGGLKRELGLAAATAIVVGNMIGSGIFMAPQGLAQLSNPTASIFAIIVTGLGTILLAICFANLGESIPETGSAIVYTKSAFGEFPSFLVGWSYWCGCWIGNGAIILGAISYASYFIPALAHNGLLAFLISAGIVWIYTLINIRGVKEAGRVNLVFTALKIIPLLF
jgi:amino acid transporter